MANNEHAQLKHNYGNNTINQIEDNNHNANVLNNTIHIVATKSNVKKNSAIILSIANLLGKIFNNTGGFVINQRKSYNHQNNLFSNNQKYNF